MMKKETWYRKMNKGNMIKENEKRNYDQEKFRENEYKKHYQGR